MIIRSLRFWLWISALFFTSCETAFERNLAADKVSLLSPANNIVTEDTTQTFYWEPLPGAKSYQLQIVSPRFDSIARLVVDSIVNRNQFQLTLLRGNYQWRVKAQNNSTYSNNSDTFRFTIQ